MSSRSNGARDQVARMLALVPYLSRREGVPVEQVAHDFSVSTRQIVKDLNVLWFCGLPEAVTGEMIDVDMDALAEGVIYVDNTEFLTRPLRLSVHEASSLAVALRTLLADAGEAERVPILSALAKLEAASGAGADVVRSVDVHVEPADPDLAATVRTALRDGRRLHLTYLVASRDETTERDVDPLRVVTAEGHRYLEAWCHLADGVRLFRLDRVLSAALTDVPVDPHDVEPRDLSAGAFQPGESAHQAVLDLAPNAQWVAEYFTLDDQQTIDEETTRVTMRVGDLSWLRALVLRHGGEIRVVSPESLAREVHDLAVRGLHVNGL